MQITLAMLVMRSVLWSSPGNNKLILRAGSRSLKIEQAVGIVERAHNLALHSRNRAAALLRKRTPARISLAGELQGALRPQQNLGQASAPH